MFKNKTKLIDCPNVLQSKKLPMFPLREKVGQLSKKKIVLCWSIFVISL